MAIEYGLRRYFDIELSHYAAFGLYLVSEVIIAINHLHTLRYLGSIYGFFDGHVQRDGVPDLQVSAVAYSLILTALRQNKNLKFSAAFSSSTPPIRRIRSKRDAEQDDGDATWEQKVAYMLEFV